MYAEDGIGFVVYKADISFKEGAVHGDVLEIRTRVEVASEYRLLFHQSAWRGGKGPLVDSVLQLCCVDRARRLVPVPAGVLVALKGLNG